MRATPRGILGLLLCSASLLSASAGAWELEYLRLRGRIQARYEAFEGNPAGEQGWGHRLDLRRARLDGRWTPFEWLQLTLETELSEGDLELRDVAAELTPHPAARFTVGNFKKPFSRLAMDSPFELPISERGLMHEYGISDSDHGGFGGRDLGLMLSGKVALPAKLKLRYYLGVWNAPGELLGQGDPQHDFVGRLQLKVWKGLVIGLHACHKLYQLSGRDDLTLTRNAFGGDVRFRWRDLWLQLEVAYGDRIDSGPGRRFLGGHLFASYRIALTDDLSLEPVVMAELFDADDQIPGGLGSRLAGQVNLHLTQHVRVALYADGAIQEPLAWNPERSVEDDLAWPLRVGVELLVRI